MLEWIILAAVIGAIMGSFINMVIYRYPLMLKAQWRTECYEFLEKPNNEKPVTFNLAFPRSHCPQCQATLPFYCNIPILSYLFLLGKCHACKKTIPVRYFFVEMLCLLLSAFIVWRFGIGIKTVALLILTWVLIALSFIDSEHYLLPDTMTLPLLWLGLLGSTQYWLISPTQAIIGAIIGYLFLWIIATLYRLIKKQDGMGLGDCKLLAVFGAWLGPTALLNVILVSSLIALFVSIIFICFDRLSAKQHIPFGPYLAIAGWWTLCFGPQLTQVLMQWMH